MVYPSPIEKTDKVSVHAHHLLQQWYFFYHMNLNVKTNFVNSKQFKNM